MTYKIDTKKEMMHLEIRLLLAKKEIKRRKSANDAIRTVKLHREQQLTSNATRTSTERLVLRKKHTTVLNMKPPRYYLGFCQRNEWLLH